MPIEVKIFKEDQLLLSSFVQEVTNYEMISSYEKLMKTNEFFTVNKELVDMRDCSLADISKEAFLSLSSLVESYLNEKYLDFKTAIVAPEDLSYGLSKLYESYSEHSPETIMVFREAKDALEWLGVPELKI